MQQIVIHMTEGHVQHGLAWQALSNNATWHACLHCCVGHVLNLRGSHEAHQVLDWVVRNSLLPLLPVPLNHHLGVEQCLDSHVLPQLLAYLASMVQV